MFLTQFHSWVVGLSLIVLAAVFLGPCLWWACRQLRRQGLFFLLIVAGFLTSMATKPSPEVVAIDKPIASEGLVYTADEQTGVTYDSRLRVSGVVQAVKAGDYKATFSLPNSTAMTTFTWSDETTGACEISWSIGPRPFTDTAVAFADIPDQAYTGVEVEPAVTMTFKGVRCSAGTDYKVAYSDNVEEGVAMASVTGIGNFTGQTNLTFKIVKEECPSTPVGKYVKYDLVKALGVVITNDVSYAAGDKVTVKVEGLAKGLKLVATPVHVDPTAKKKVIADYTYTIEGVPTESVDFATQPMFVRVTVAYKDKAKGKVETLQPLVLSVVTPEPAELEVGTLNEVYEPIDIAALWPAVADAKVHPKEWSFKGWPSGIKYNATAKDANWSYKDSEGKTVKTTAEPYTIYGVPTKAGVYPIAATHKHKLTDNKTTVSETYSAVMTVWGDDGATDFRYTDQAYVATVTKTLTGVTGVSGQPTGIKFDKKNGKLSGTPTKPGVYATTVTYSDKTKKTFLWKVTEGENKGFLGTMDWTVKNSAVTVMQGVIQTNWTCKLPADAKVTASTLPTGLKLALNKEKTAWVLSGTPTKEGNYVVTFKTVMNGATVTERISFVVKANEWTGTWYGVQYLERDASLMGEVTVSANGTVKFVFTEGTTNYNAKGVVSQVTKTAVTVKNLDSNGKTATLTLPKDKKNPLSVDRACVLDFDRNRIMVDGEKVMNLHEKLATDDYCVGYWSEVTTIVAEEVQDAETNAYAYVTVTFDAKKRSFALAGKLWDGTAVKGTTYMILSDAGPATSPILVVDKAKNAVLMTFACDDVGHVCASFVENGKAVSIGKWGYIPWSEQFPASDLKSKKFNQLTSDDQLVILVDAASSPRPEELVLDIPQKSLATSVSAQGLVAFKNLKDETDGWTGWTWVCELLPVDNGGETQFRGIATGTWKNPETKTTETRYCPVWTK